VTVDPNRTYFVVYTIEADNPGDLVEDLASLDPPTEVPTVAELRDRIAGAIIQVNVLSAQEAAALADRLVEIVTLGNVPAGFAS